ncbi:unnamed protein product [Trifolium pratense]|uniref:Uncharacterized protein n=1 Tax=Trifolium pratense TaxID=57577 RepID=A0ACB0JTC5_TRIPR|nr:unnamed protein product [Trifolium pratense]
MLEIFAKALVFGSRSWWNSPYARAQNVEIGIRCVKTEHGNELCVAIQEMEFLESLNITAKDEEEMNLDLAPAPCNLRVVNLKARLTTLPNWIHRTEILSEIFLPISFH